METTEMKKIISDTVFKNYDFLKNEFGIETGLEIIKKIGKENYLRFLATSIAFHVRENIKAKRWVYDHAEYVERRNTGEWLLGYENADVLLKLADLA